MTIKTESIEMEKEEIKNDLDEKIDDGKLAELKARLTAKSKEKENINKKEKAINFGVIGTGQCGNRIAESFYNLGMDAMCFNTAKTDLQTIKIPESNKFLLDNSIGGAAKSLELGERAAQDHKTQIKEVIEKQFANSQIIILALSLGGGSGAGSVETFVDIINEIGKPILCMCVLTMISDDVLAKNNALITLNKLSKFTQEKKISSIVCIDNAKIERLFSDVSQLDFFNVANSEITSQFDAMNTLAALPGITKSIDKMEWLKILLDGEGYCIYGSIKINKFNDELDIAEALINNIDKNLLSSSFNVKQSKYCGIFLSANENVWRSIPSSVINYCVSYINDSFNNPLGVFKGTYVNDDIKENIIVAHFIYSGLGLPEARINNLKIEIDNLNSIIKDKSQNRNISLDMGFNNDKTISKAQEIKEKIASKNSTFNKFINGTVDRRNK